MKTSLFRRIKNAFGMRERLHPIDQQMAKHWIKQRLAKVFPHLRNNPAALEKAYRSLGLDPRQGQEEGEADAVFEMSFPENLME